MPFTSKINIDIFLSLSLELYFINCSANGYNKELVFPLPIVPVTKIFWNKPLCGINILLLLLSIPTSKFKSLWFTGFALFLLSVDKWEIFLLFEKNVIFENLFNKYLDKISEEKNEIII